MSNQGTPDNPVILFGSVDFRNQRTNFGIKMDDRRRHMYVIGKSGMGKSELLKNLAIQDIQEGRGLAFVDPHGDPVEDLLDYIPPERINDVIYINPADMQYPISFNVMEHVDYDQRHLVADGLMAVFKKIWVDQWSARMEYILNNVVLALLEAPGSTLLGINRMMSEKEYRKQIVDQVKDTEVKAFWTQEFARWNDRYAADATAAIQNKIGQFVSNPLIRNIVGQVESSFNIREALDQRKIFLMNISKGRIGEDASRLLGAMLITRIQLAAMSRVDVPKHERPDFCLVVDEFQNFATAAFANILSEARKFNLSLIVAHQYVNQMSEEVRDAIFGNVGTIISFRVGAEDAELLEKEFAPVFSAQDIVNLGKRDIYLKLAIDGISSNAFAARTMDTMTPPEHSTREQVIEASRKAYGRSREAVESAIEKWREPVEEPARPPRSRSGETGPRRAPQDVRSYQATEGERSAQAQHRGVQATEGERSAQAQHRGVQQSGPPRRDGSPQRSVPRRDDQQNRSTSGGPRRDEQRAPRRENRPAPHAVEGRSQQTTESGRPSVQRGVQARKEPLKSTGVSLDALKGDQTVDFKGRSVQQKNTDATLTSAPTGEDLKALIAKALSKK